MKKIIFIILALSLVSVIRGQTSETTPDASKTLTWVEKKQCGLQIDGVEICLVTSSVSAIAGKSSVPVIISFQNPNSNTVSFRRRTLDEIFDIEVTDSNGAKVLSFNEILQKKIREKTIKDEDVIQELPIRSGPVSIEIEPGKEVKGEYSLNYIYDFSVPDRYTVKFWKKDAKKAENLIGTVTIEIK